MKKINKPLFLPFITTLLLMTGCGKENTPGSEATIENETVKVTLHLNRVAVEQPGAGAKSSVQTKLGEQVSSASAERIIASERFGGLLLELVESPAEPATRTVDEDAIANFWVFQFDGYATTSRLVKKAYFSTYSADMELNLLKGTDQRVVILVNTFDETLGDRFTLRTSIYQDLFKLSKNIISETDVLTNSGNHIPMGGIVLGNLDKGIVLNIDIRRNVAQVSAEVKNGNLVFPTGEWKVQMCNVVKQSYYDYASEYNKRAVFPETVTTFNYPEATLPTISTADFVKAGTWYIIPNCRGIKDGTLSSQRVTNAPKNATCLKIWGLANGVIHVYTIHLGANFTTDYNLYPNYRYTYRITLYDNKDDTRLQIDEYVGMFGGELKEITHGVWQFTKMLYINGANEQGSDSWTTAFVWSKSSENDHSALAGDKVPNYTRDGRQITWNLNRGLGGSLTEFPAANICYKKLGNPDSPNSAADLVWYLPAQDQLMAVWAAHESFIKTLDNPNDGSLNYYLSATEYSRNKDIWYMSFGNGSCSSTVKFSINRVRCVREL